ncbi:MAG: response regulator [Limisphaerales bacterium]
MITAKKRVLIVDDEPSFTRLLKLNLHHTGRFTAEVVNDSTEAVQAAERFTPDIVLLDVMMPGLDGGDVADRLHAVPKFRSVPIIFLTAAVKRQEVRAHAGLCGGIPFIAKPIEFEEVLTEIDKACGVKRCQQWDEHA